MVNIHNWHLALVITAMILILPNALRIVQGVAVINVRGTNSSSQISATKVQGEKVEFLCRSGNLLSTKNQVTKDVQVYWFYNGSPISDITSLKSRIKDNASNGILIINPIESNDTGIYECRWVTSNEIDAEVESSWIYLNVEYPAQVYYTPTTIQQIKAGQSATINCYIRANPPIQWVTWTKNRHLIESSPESELDDDFSVLNNGSLLLHNVNLSDEGNYTCTPYNIHGTSGTSGIIQVVVVVVEDDTFDEIVVIDVPA